MTDFFPFVIHLPYIIINMIRFIPLVNLISSMTADRQTTLKNYTNYLEISTKCKVKLAKHSNIIHPI